MDLGSADAWGVAIYFWILPAVLGDAVFPPVPSELVVITGGALAAEGRANIFLVVALAAFASWIGDVVVFHLFKRKLSHLLDRWRWGRRLHTGIHQAIALAGRSSTYGTIIGARFVPGGRLATSAAAGIGDVGARSFSLCAGLGALLWSCWLVGLGYVTGSTTGLPFWASSLIGVAVGLVVGAGVGIVVARRRRHPPAGRQTDGPTEEPGTPGPEF